MPHEFKIGDVVHLNSNPEMKFTVNSFIEDPFRETQIEIVYFNEKNNRFEYHKFNPKLLMKAGVSL